MKNADDSTNLSDVDDIVRSRTWRRNVPLLLGLFGTYLLFMPAIRAAARAGLAPIDTLRYVGYGLMTLLACYFLSIRFYRVAAVSVPTRRWAKWVFQLADLIIWLLSGVGIGFLLLAALHLIFQYY